MRTIIIALTLMFIAACTLQGTAVDPTTPEDAGFSAEPTDSNMTNESETAELAEPVEDPVNTTAFEGMSLAYVEGDLVVLSPEAVDPDGDTVQYFFSEPVGDDGRWQTEIGDEGEYVVEVVASDGRLQTESEVLLIIERANRPPVIDCVAEVTLREGERFFVGDYCDYLDEDGEEVVVQYAGWPGTSRYVTNYDDAGEHTLIIIANDKVHTVREELPITVLNTNRKPEFSGSFPEKVVGTEGDVLTISTEDVLDPDGDKLNFEFSSPFSNNGIWRTELGDAGTYSVDVVATDGDSTVKETVTVEIQLANTKPQLERIPDIEVDEGETITLPISASDREGDDLTIEIEGWMDSRTYTTDYDDAGEYTVRVSVSDGVHTTSQVVNIRVNDVNRPPQFVTVA